MALKNKGAVILFFLLCWSSIGQSKILLPELLTKQSVSNIRFLSKDGKFTYYQKRSGSLLFSTNYKVQEMLKGRIGTEYTLFASTARKKIIIMQNLDFNTFYSIRARQNLFLVNFGESTPREIGTGIAPTLLLNDTWFTYYDAYTRVLSFENTSSSALKFSIRLNNRINPYFVPKVVMSDDNTVYYTDLSENGAPGILEFKRNTAKSEILYKAPSPLMKVDLCVKQDHLIIGLFGIHFSNQGSNISSASLPLKDFSKRETLYQSEQNDLGHMICDFEEDNIVFIKNFGTKDNPAYDVAALNTKDKKLAPMTDLKSVTNIINMDGTLLTQEKGKFYIVKGEADYKSSDTLKAKPIPAKDAAQPKDNPDE